MGIDVVLVEPEIPQNTGNVARTCAAAGCGLILVGELGFGLDDARMRRAGLDYWEFVGIRRCADLDELKAGSAGAKLIYASTKSASVYTDVDYAAHEDLMLVFGSETSGLPEGLLKDNYADCVRIPMDARARSLNLSNSVAIVLYEALRQRGFRGLLGRGSLHR
ncbi:MAG: tRNA (cytidine(34)-2'-O)-methyltransferase [Oscillospiraceae bacterium]|nr:tRNA (cytidine(34)-2'-O)-methyltransferase [Oscillospiraceae bacterium]